MIQLASAQLLLLHTFLQRLLLGFFGGFVSTFLIFSWNVRTIIAFCVSIQEQARREKIELERMLEENRRKVEEAQRREALEQQRREEESYRELEELQRQKEEAMRMKKKQEEEERANQIKLLGKNKARPKVSFALSLK